MIDNIFINSSDISDHLPLFIQKQNLFTKKSSQQNTNVKYRLINDSTITNLRQSLLCLDLNRITGSDNCTKAMEFLAHAVDNTYKLCCSILSNLKHFQTRSCEIISNIKKIHYFALYCQNKIPKIFILISEILSPGKSDDQRRIIMNINSRLQKRYKANFLYPQ